MEKNDKSIGIASDHAGYALKTNMISWLTDKGYHVTDYGTNSEESCDYPDFAHPLADSVEEEKNVLGISICGSGNGINMAVNKHAGIRSALCWLPEIARLARQHNDANILSIPARFIDEAVAKEIVEAFLLGEFEGGRHQRRVDKIAK